MNNIYTTVLMPAYNAEKYIKEAIDSVLAQSYRDFELLIINDGSTDNTAGIINTYTDKRIRMIDENKCGISAALNIGLREAKGELIARFDADDICMPERLAKQVEFLEKNPEYVLVGSDAEYISAKGELLFHFRAAGHSHEEILSEMKNYCPFIHAGVMYRKSQVLQAGGYSIDAHTFEDYLMWVKLSSFGKYFNIPEALIRVRINPDSITIDEKWRGRKFRKLKRKIIHEGDVTPEEGKILEGIIKKQNNERIKKGAYYALCGKKFLLDNYQPVKARKNLMKASGFHPFRIDNYALLILSFFPRSFIKWLHSKSPNRI